MPATNLPPEGIMRKSCTIAGIDQISLSCQNKGKDVDSIKVKVHTILGIKKIIGKGEIEISLPRGASLGAAIVALVHTWGEGLKSRLLESDNPVKIQPYIRLMVNGRDIAFLAGMDTALQDGDEILILPPVSGG